MKIKCSYKSSYEAFRDFCRFALFKAVSVKVYSVIFFVSLFAIIAYMSIYGGSGILTTLLVIVLLMGAIMAFMYFLLPKAKYSAMYEKYSEPAEMEFIFEASFFSVYIKDNYSGRTEKTLCPYQKIYTAYETKKYFFIYMDKNRAYIIQKSKVQGGSAAVKQVSDTFKAALGKKYRKKRI